MKPIVIVGVLLAIGGGFLLARGMSLSSRRDSIRIGGVEASVQTREPVPQWVGIAVLAGGAVLVGAGLRTNRRAR